MKVKLISHTFPDDPDWIVVNPSVPLGTIYEVLGHEEEGFKLKNKYTNKIRNVEVYLLEGNGGRGYIPVDCFEVIDDE